MYWCLPYVSNDTRVHAFYNNSSYHPGYVQLTFGEGFCLKSTPPAGKGVFGVLSIFDFDQDGLVGRASQLIGITDGELHRFGTIFYRLDR